MAGATVKHVAGRPPAPGPVDPAVPAPQVQLQPDMPTAEALRRVVHACLRHLIANQAGVAAGNSEALHQMRLALRRLRVTLAIFADLAADRRAKQIRIQLRAMLDGLAPARDLDVVLEEFLAPLRRRYGSRRGLPALCRKIGRLRAAALQGAAVAVQRPAFRALYTDIATWVETAPSTGRGATSRRGVAGRHLSVWAGSGLARRRRRLKRAGADIGSLTPADRHRLRIRAKKLRFAYECFACLAMRRRRQLRHAAAVAALRDLQGALGGLSDIAQCVAWVSRVAGDQTGPDTASAARLVVATAEARCGRLVRAAQEACDRFGAVKPFWTQR
jgi:triphosphatase